MHWYSLDEAVFWLPIDVGNVPALVEAEVQHGKVSPTYLCAFLTNAEMKEM
jgi:hypothetical protein